MAGHSQFANIKHKKEAQDGKRSRIFTKIARVIEVAARSGADPDMNPKLRSAIAAARKVNMPKDRIQQSVLKGSGATTATNYDEVNYEGRHSSSGIYFIVKALTDNRNRTASEVRCVLGKYGAVLCAAAYMFDSVGCVTYAAEGVSEEALMEKAIELGALDLRAADGALYVYTAIPDLERVASGLEPDFGESAETRILWKAKEWATVEDEDALTSFHKLIDALEDLDDVQNVDSNL
jgi:YebC/PmpR family DNA-binding regulatory protein